MHYHRASCVQDSLQRHEEAQHSTRGMLLYTRTLVRPITKRLALLYNVFRDTIGGCLNSTRDVLSPKPHDNGSASGAGGSGASCMAPSRVTQIIVDRLYNRLLHDDQLCGRC